MSEREQLATILRRWVPEADLPEAIAALATLNATPPAGGVGWKLVPREPTPEMLHAAFGSADEDNAWRLQAAYDATPAQPEAMPGREAIVAELCEALEGLKNKSMHHDGCFISPCTCGVKKAYDKACQALSKARGAAG